MLSCSNYSLSCGSSLNVKQLQPVQLTLGWARWSRGKVGQEALVIGSAATGAHRSSCQNWPASAFRNGRRAATASACAPSSTGCPGRGFHAAASLAETASPITNERSRETSSIRSTALSSRWTHSSMRRWLAGAPAAAATGRSSSAGNSQAVQMDVCLACAVSVDACQLQKSTCREPTRI